MSVRHEDNVIDDNGHSNDEKKKREPGSRLIVFGLIYTPVMIIGSIMGAAAAGGLPSAAQFGIWCATGGGITLIGLAIRGYASKKAKNDLTENSEQDVVTPQKDNISTTRSTNEALYIKDEDEAKSKDVGECVLGEDTTNPGDNVALNKNAETSFCKYCGSEKAKDEKCLNCGKGISHKQRVMICLAAASFVLVGFVCYRIGVVRSSPPSAPVSSVQVRSLGITYDELLKELRVYSPDIELPDEFEIDDYGTYFGGSYLALHVKYSVDSYGLMKHISISSVYDNKYNEDFTATMLNIYTALDDLDSIDSFAKLIEGAHNKVNADQPTFTYPDGSKIYYHTIEVNNKYYSYGILPMPKPGTSVHTFVASFDNPEE